MTKIVFLILTMLLGADDWVIASQEPNYKLYYSEELKTSKWLGYPDSNYAWDGERLSYERIVKDEDGNDVTVKTYKDPIEIIADFKPDSKVYGVEGNIERNAVQKFGGALKGFVWLDKVSGGGEVILPFTAPHIFIARGDRLNPVLTEIDTDPNSDNYYEVIEGKTRVVVKSFSGIGGAAGAPPTLIAHYKMNDNLATDVIIDETGSHNAAVKDAGGTATSAFHSVTGKINNAQDLEGTDDYIEIPDHADFTPALTPFSISVWVYMHDATNFIIASKYELGKREWLFYVNHEDKIYFILCDESNSAVIGRFSSTALTPYENQWIHLVATSDGGTLSSGIKIYLNRNRIDDTDYDRATFISVEDLTDVVSIGKYSS